MVDAHDSRPADIDAFMASYRAETQPDGPARERMQARIAASLGAAALGGATAASLATAPTTATAAASGATGTGSANVAGSALVKLGHLIASSPMVAGATGLGVAGTITGAVVLSDPASDAAGSVIIEADSTVLIPSSTIDRSSNHAATDGVPPSPEVEEPPATADGQTLAIEAGILRRAHAALQRGDAQAAHRELRAHAETFPGGLLVPERRALSLGHACLAKLEAARDEARRFVRARPHDKYAGQLRELCQLARPPATGEVR